MRDNVRHFRTGDMGRLDNGVLSITGRLKEQYKLDNGKYVVPGPLEESFKSIRFIQNIFIFGDNKPYNIALVVPDLEPFLGRLYVTSLLTRPIPCLRAEDQAPGLRRRNVLIFWASFRQKLRSLANYPTRASRLLVAFFCWTKSSRLKMGC